MLPESAATIGKVVSHMQVVTCAIERLSHVDERRLVTRGESTSCLEVLLRKGSEVFFICYIKSMYSFC